MLVTEGNLRAMKYPSYRVYYTRDEFADRLTVVMHPDLTIKIAANFVPYKKLLAETDAKIKKKSLRILTSVLEKWVNNCLSEKMEIDEIELVLPPMGDYLDPENKIGLYFGKKYGIHFFITIGVQISLEIPDKLNTAYNRQNLRKMRNANGEMN